MAILPFDSAGETRELTVAVLHRLLEHSLDAWLHHDHSSLPLVLALEVLGLESRLDLLLGMLQVQGRVD